MINARVTVHLYGQMGASTLVSGSRASSTGMERISAKKACRKKESGKMVARSGGLAKKGHKMTFRTICNDFRTIKF